MRIGVYLQEGVSSSYRVYRENVMRELAALGVELVPFEASKAVPGDCRLLWNPGGRLRRLVELLQSSATPVVVTIHGPAPFVLPVYELERRWKHWGAIYVRRALTAYRWRRFGKRVAGLIAVSRSAAAEAARLSRLPHERIYPVYHGVDHELFRVAGDRAATDRPYFLYAAADDRPLKNVDRVISAYTQLPQGQRPGLVVISPGLSTHISIPGVTLIDRIVSQVELTRWYRGALAFVFPSLHETFGMPILEAMACGCPVITSTVAACPEVAGDAALLVNPRAANEIRCAMQRIAEDHALRHALREKGLVRAAEFTWRKSAEGHVRVFEEIARDAARAGES